MPISREVQERKGDVTEAADEAVVGIEMVQAFGREDDVRERFGDKAEAGPRRGDPSGAGRGPAPAGAVLPAVAVGRAVVLLRRQAR